jgi:hypothetical protein
VRRFMISFENPFQEVLRIAREAEARGIDLDVLLPILYKTFLVSPTAIKEELANEKNRSEIQQ